MQLENFLRLVLPNEGIKCWVEIRKDKTAIQGFTPSTEELAKKLQEIDARGVDAYFACASFQTDRNRRGANALGARSFWMDIDAGEGKPYATAEDAIQAADEFCARVGLPVPGIVRSGGGAHAYWPLDRTLPRAEWLSVAQRFKLLAHSHGLHADPARTADIASILRPPGTKNYKLPNSQQAGGGKPAAGRSVEIDDEEYFQPLSCEEFLTTVINSPYGNEEGAPRSPAPPRSPELIPTQSNANLIAGLHASKAFDGTKGMKEGGRNDACVRYAGELLARGQTPEDVLAACLKWNQLNEPPMDEQEVRTCVNSITRRHAENNPAPALLTSAPAAMPVLPANFRWGPAGQLVVDIANEAGIKEAKIISDRPVFLKTFLNLECTAQKNAYLFQSLHMQKGWQEFPVSAQGFNGSDWYGFFVENGVSIRSGMDKHFKICMREMENMLRKSGNESAQYSQFGWKDGDKSFLVGENLVHANGHVEKSYGTTKLMPLMQIMKPSTSGTLAAWTQAADKLFTPGMEAHGLMLLASFAAPLMKFCVDEGNGGSILSIVSEDSGHGKTPMASAIASVWGGIAATVVTGNFTENRRIEDLVRHCHLVQVQEEMAYGDPQIAAEGVKKFTSGADRGRLDRGGAGTGIPERYQTILVSLSNKSLYDLVRMVDAPMSWRIFELEIDRPGDEILGNLGGITRDMMVNCGHAGLQFIRYVVNPQVHQYVLEHLTGTNGRIGGVIQKYRDQLETKPEHRFIVWLLASIEVAANILTHYGLLHFDVNRIMSWAANQARNRIEGTPADDPTAKLHQFLSENIGACITVRDPYIPGKAPAMPVRLPLHHLYMRLEITSGRLYISQTPLMKWCVKNGISYLNLGKKLLENGVLLERSKPVTLGAGTEIPSARALCWEVDTGHPRISNIMRIVDEKEDKREKVSN